MRLCEYRALNIVDAGVRQGDVVGVTGSTDRGGTPLTAVRLDHVMRGRGR